MALVPRARNKPNNGSDSGESREDRPVVRSVMDGSGQLRDVAPHVERSVRHAIDANAQPLQPREQAIALGPEHLVDRVRLANHVRLFEQRHGRALNRFVAPAIEEAAC